MQKFLDEIYSLKNNEKVLALRRFFKTGKGEYAEKDCFLGINNPILRVLSKKYYKEITIPELAELIQNKFHEIRLTTLFMMVLKYEKGDLKTKNEIFDLYMASLEHINNWDLVDLSARQIVGDFAYSKPQIIWELAYSNHLWSERIAIVASWHNIKRNEFSLTFELVKHFINHKHDLIHKACGWMLREVGKKDENSLLSFLDKYANKLPRTTLRYSIERLNTKQKALYLKLKSL